MIDGVYETFIAKSRYARYLDNKARRENWGETVDRYIDFMQDHLLEKHEYLIPDEIVEEIREAITDVETFPSMRALMTAGEALERDNTAGFNCSYLPVDDIKSFDEAMYILMCGKPITCLTVITLLIAGNS